MPTPTYTLPPTPPTRGDATTFSARVAAFLAWIVTFVAELITATAWFAEQTDEVSAAASEIAASALLAADAAGLRGDIVGSLALGAGNKDFVLSSPKPLLLTLNRQVILILKSDSSIRMVGNVAASPAPTSTSARVTVVSGGVFPPGSSGTYSDWQILDAAFAQQGASAAEYRAAVRTDQAAVTPKTISDANQPTVLNWASTITPDMSAGHRRTLTASASFTMGAPTNCLPGDTFEVDITNSAGSIVLAVAAAWKRQGGLGIIGPNNTDRSTFIGLVQEVSGGTMTRGLYAIVRTPT